MLRRYCICICFVYSKSINSNLSGGDYLSFLLVLNKTVYLLQWDPPTLDQVDNGKVDLVFLPFEEDLELQIPDKDELRLVGFAQSLTS